MLKIKRSLLECISEAAKNTYPREFFALLGRSKNEVIDELIVVPSVYGKTHVLVKSHLIPIDSKIAGSVHSHPANSSKPSAEDIGSFPIFGEVHLIISWPFSIENIKAYDVFGKEIHWVVVE
ncbi:MAG: Mov34/MPN/PAD-1 family protein [Candidatus Diapherotrites archaeon]|nr:Mov34/MPN/PAD-1 family protein [Candidatus Diapherotrites archaeon]